MTFTQTIHADLDVCEALEEIRRGEGDMLTATQCRTARAVEGLSINRLAQRTRGVVSEKTIADFENGRNMPNPATLMALRQALTGIVRFTKGGGFEWRKSEHGCLLTRAQCRVARALLGWDMNDLANRTSGAVRVNTIERFENGLSRPIRATQKALRQAFEEAGVRFTEEYEGMDRGTTMRVAVITG